MSGVKGKSGGRRDGAGRPPQNFTVKDDTVVLTRYECEDGRTQTRRATVELRGRGRNRHIHLVHDDGSRIVISIYT